MAEAVSTPGMFGLHQQRFEQQRDLTPCQEYRPNLRQPRASKRAAVDANAMGDGECSLRTCHFFGFFGDVSVYKRMRDHHGAHGRAKGSIYERKPPTP